MQSNPDETTPMVPVGDPGKWIIIFFIIQVHPEKLEYFSQCLGPSYVYPGHKPRLRERQTKQFQCCICAGLL